MTSAAGLPSSFDPDAQGREQQRLEAQKVNESMHFAAGDDAVALFRKTRSDDPYPLIPSALLNSADIAAYVSATGMIDPFHPRRLKTASYEVALLGKWTYVDEDGQMRTGVLKDGEDFTLPKNSIVFMTAEPTFRLPDYIALRHNLKIDHVYKGLLVGTGPLVDPGFTGKLSLPIHNLTEHPYVLKGGKGIIWVEFTKLSPNAKWDKRSDSGSRPGAYTPFPASKTEKKGVDEYIFDAVGLLGTPSSSSASISKNASEAKEIASAASTRVGNLTRNFTIAVAVSILGLIAAVIVPLEIHLIDVNNAQQSQIDTVMGELGRLTSASPTPSGPLPTSTPSGSPTP